VLRGTLIFLVAMENFWSHLKVLFGLLGKPKFSKSVEDTHPGSCLDIGRGPFVAMVLEVDSRLLGKPQQVGGGTAETMLST